ncbi:MAG TPA: hypothetical protein ENK98_02320 [Epsilonproteobacteria bacterium]|nr:hypothetical protein [Campylobacterota bacterium]
MGTRVKLSTLWIVVMFNMVFADILSLMMPSFLQGLLSGNAENIPITQELLLVFAVTLEIPIAMIFLSRVLPYKINKRLNIVTSIFTILFIVGGGSLTYHYLFFATVEIVCLLSILIYAYKWKEISE